eukprot:g45657.t1
MSCTGLFRVKEQWTRVSWKEWSLRKADKEGDGILGLVVVSSRRWQKWQLMILWMWILVGWVKDVSEQVQDALKWEETRAVGQQVKWPKKSETKASKIKQKNRQGEVSEHGSSCLLFTMDMQSLYKSIPHQEGLRALRFFLQQRSEPYPVTTILLCLAKLVLTLNNFSFNSSHFC